MDRTRFKLLYRYARQRGLLSDKYGAPEMTVSDGVRFWFSTHVRHHRSAWINRPDETELRYAAFIGGHGTDVVRLRRSYVEISRRQPPVPLP